MPTEHHMSDRDPDHVYLIAALDRYERPLIRYALGIVCEINHARDIVQDVFIKLHESLPTLDRERLAPWLFTVCRNRSLDYKRKNKRLVPMELEILDKESSSLPGPSEEMEQKELSGQLKHWIAALPDKQRDAVRLKFEAGLSYKEISETLKTSIGNVGTLIHHGVAALREQWLTMNA